MSVEWVTILMFGSMIVMLLLGLPYSEPVLSTTRTGGTPYGASHVSGPQGDAALSPDEQVLGDALGRRLAEVTAALQRARTAPDASAG